MLGKVVILSALVCMVLAEHQVSKRGIISYGSGGYGGGHGNVDTYALAKQQAAQQSALAAEAQAAVNEAKQHLFELKAKAASQESFAAAKEAAAAAAVASAGTFSHGGGYGGYGKSY